MNSTWVRCCGNDLPFRSFIPFRFEQFCYEYEIYVYIYIFQSYIYIYIYDSVLLNDKITQIS